MDLGDLLILLLFLFPILSRLFGKQEKPTPQRTRPLSRPDRLEGSQRTDADDPLADALRQIREALGEAEPEPDGPPARPEPLPEQPRPVTRQPARPTGFHNLGAYEHDEHGFGRSNPISEEVFERQPAFQAKGGTDRIKQKPLKSVDLAAPIEVKKAAPSKRSGLARTLRDPAQAREAFVLKEILGPPRSRRPRR